MDREPSDWSGRPTGRPTAQQATICLGDGREARAIVTNLSNNGCQLVAEVELSVGETLALIPPGRGPIDAQVRWTADDRAGVRFLTGDSPSEQRGARIGARPA